METGYRVVVQAEKRHFMELAARKRGAQDRHGERQHGEREHASLDPLSSSAPAMKRRCTEQQQAQPSSAPASPSVFDLPTGHLEDRFRLSDRVLGSGQFGTAKLCTDLFSGEPVACKSVRKSAASAERQRRELRNEVELMLRLQGHDNLVQLRGVFEDEESVHLVMDLCQGGDLFEETVRRQCFSEADAARLFAEVVRAVSFCHSRGVMHRDLKPENILLARSMDPGVPLAQAAGQGPLVKLADFGLATLVPAGSSVTGMAGSPFYMAPEVLTRDYGLKADVWSLGVILYILLSGSPPFWGPTDADVFQATLNNKPDLTSGCWSGVSAEAKNLVRCLLVKDPARRPSVHKIITHPWFAQQLAHKRAVRTSLQGAGGSRSLAVV